MLLVMGVSLIEIKFYAAKTDYQDCVLIRVHLSSSVVLFFFAANYKGLRNTHNDRLRLSFLRYFWLPFFKPRMDTDKHGYRNLHSRLL